MKSDNASTRKARGEISQTQAHALLEAAELLMRELHTTTGTGGVIALAAAIDATKGETA